jgi:hypothetical protein
VPEPITRSASEEQMKGVSRSPGDHQDGTSVVAPAIMARHSHGDITKTVGVEVTHTGNDKARLFLGDFCGALPENVISA